MRSTRTTGLSGRASRTCRTRTAVPTSRRTNKGRSGPGLAGPRPPLTGEKKPLKAVTKTLLAVLAAVLLLTIGALLPKGSVARDITATAGTGAQTYSANPNGSAADVQELTQRLEANPDDAATRAALGVAYVRQATSTGHPELFEDAETQLRVALRSGERGRAPALTGMAFLANARHEFRASAAWARKAIEADLYASAPQGLLGDALFQLGKYNASDAAYERMVALRPDAASYVRIGYARSFRGDTAGAKQAMQLALQAAGPVGEEAAFIRHQLGDIYLGSQDWAEARRQNRIGMKLAPGFVPPTVGVAEAAFGRGNVQRSIEILEDAVRELPTLEYEKKLADLYAVAGRSDDAERQWAVVADRLAAFRAHGMQPDVDLIVFYVDHDLRPQAAVAEARSVYADRPTAPAADALAWALHGVGKDSQAIRFAELSLRGPAASPSHLVHAAEIASALGQEGRSERYLEEARANGAFFDPSIVATTVE